MTTLLLSHHFHKTHGADILAATAGGSVVLELLALPAEREARLSDAECARIDAAFFSGDVFPDYSRQFFSTVRKAPGLKWMHVFNAGIDHPIYAEMLARGVRLTTSSGSTAEPIAQTALTALLMLARNFPRWRDAQARRTWNPMRYPDVPRDLGGQTALIIGVGHIGNEIARLARVLGLRVIGVRRSAITPDDHVDEMHPPAALAELLPQADWLIIACPLTPQTRGLIGAGLLARLPQGARIINIARGEIVDENALHSALAEGRVAGAYLDVFEKEPLPPDSPLWDMPNVLITPHNSAAADGNDRRVYEMFLANLKSWQQGGPLSNEVRSTSS